MHLSGLFGIQQEEILDVAFINENKSQLIIVSLSLSLLIYFICDVDLH
mgnify:CR=1 FL=1